MEYLLVVDIQPEFVKDKPGKKVYDKCIEFLKTQGHHYTVVALVYQNKNNSNMEKLLDWHKMKEILPLEFTADFSLVHSGYSVENYPAFCPDDIVHIFGFDTDACVLSTCFDIFNKDIKFDIWTDMCWSSGGKEMHEIALAVMKRQFGKAVTTNSSSTN